VCLEAEPRKPPAPAACCDDIDHLAVTRRLCCGNRRAQACRRSKMKHRKYHPRDASILPPSRTTHGPITHLPRQSRFMRHNVSNQHIFNVRRHGCVRNRLAIPAAGRRNAWCMPAGGGRWCLDAKSPSRPQMVNSPVHLNSAQKIIRCYSDMK